MDAVKFIEERNRMCGTMSEMWGVDAEQIVKNTEEWSAAHPRKTRQSVFLEQYPNARIDSQAVIYVCPAIAAKNSGHRRWSDGNFENCFPAADGSRCAGQFDGKYRQQGGMGYQFAMAGRVYPVYCADSAKYELRGGKE